jgi:GT2 family glycosyltransferase
MNLGLSSPQSDLELRAVLIDNGSTTGIVQKLGDWLEVAGDTRLTLIHAERNGGYAYGVNTGIRYFLEADPPDYLWLLNNDVHLDREALVSLVTAAETQPDVVLWGSTIVRDDGTDLLECAGGYTYSALTTRVAACHAGRQLQEAGTLVATAMDYICGAAMFARASVFKQVGLLCEDYFLYFEEQDLVHRLPQPAQIAWCPDSIVYHRGAASTSGDRQGRSAVQ